MNSIKVKHPIVEKLYTDKQFEAFGYIKKEVNANFKIHSIYQGDNEELTIFSKDSIPENAEVTYLDYPCKII